MSADNLVSPHVLELVPAVAGWEAGKWQGVVLWVMVSPLQGAGFIQLCSQVATGIIYLPDLGL